MKKIEKIESGDKKGYTAKKYSSDEILYLIFNFYNNGGGELFVINPNKPDDDLGEYFLFKRY